MNQKACQYYAKKFFPHLLPEHGAKLVLELWNLHYHKPL